MNAALAVVAVLPWSDWLAVGLFFGGWVGYASFAHRRAQVQPSLLASP